MSKLMALLGIQPAEDQFLMAAIKDLGVTTEGLSDARKANDTSFLETHIKARISTADGTAKAATDRANAIIAATGVKADAADIAAEVAKAIETKAAAKAAEILAQRGIPASKLAAATGGTPAPAKELQGMDLAFAANRARHAARAAASN